MKHWLLLLLSLHLASANPLILLSGSPTVPAGGSDISQDFEGSGLPSGWSTTAGTPDYDYATSPAPLAGSESLYIDGESEAVNATVSFTATDTVYCRFYMMLDNLNSASRRQFAILNSGSAIAELFLAPGPSQTSITNGTTTASETSNNWSADTLYYVWFEYAKGTGSNGITRIYVSTTKTKPAISAALCKEITNGDSTDQANQFYFGTWAAGGGDLIFDNLEISFSSAFGDFP